MSVLCAADFDDAVLNFGDTEDIIGRVQKTH